MEGENAVADIGSGGGLPGIPLAIVNRGMKFILIERREKKVQFLLEVKEEIGLNNVVILLKNFEEVRELETETFVSRGVRLENGIISHAKKLAAKGRYIYFKGKSFDSKKYPFLRNYKTEERKEILIVYL